jgi:hypothetical protein
LFQLNRDNKTTKASDLRQFDGSREVDDPFSSLSSTSPFDPFNSPIITATPIKPSSGFSNKPLLAPTSSLPENTIVNPFLSNNNHNRFQNGISLGSSSLEAHHDELNELRRQQELSKLTQFETATMSTSKKFERSQSEFVVTKMTIQQPFQILQNQHTVVFDRTKANPHQKPQLIPQHHQFQQHQQRQSNGQSPATETDLSSSTTTAITLTDAQNLADHEAVHDYRQGETTHAVQFSRDTLHHSLKRHTVHKHVDNERLLSIPVTNQFGQVINPKKLTTADFEHVVSQSQDNPRMLLSDFVPKTSMNFTAQRDLRQAFRDTGMEKQGKKLFAVQQQVDKQMMDIAKSIDVLEGKTQLKSRIESIEHLKQKGFKDRQRRVMTAMPSAYDMDPSRTIVSAAVVDQLRKRDPNIAQDRFICQGDGTFVDTFKIAKQHRLNKQIDKHQKQYAKHEQLQHEENNRNAKQARRNHHQQQQQNKPHHSKQPHQSQQKHTQSAPADVSTTNRT